MNGRDDKGGGAISCSSSAALSGSDSMQERDWTPEEYAWSCADDMRGWALRAEEAARDLREQNFQLRREIADLKKRLAATEEQADRFADRLGKAARG